MKRNKMDKETYEDYNNRWEGYKVWERLKKPVDIGTEDVTIATVLGYIGCREKYRNEKK